MQPTGQGHELPCICGVDSQVAACSLDLKALFISVSDKPPAQVIVGHRHYYLDVSWLGPSPPQCSEIFREESP